MPKKFISNHSHTLMANYNGRKLFFIENQLKWTQYVNYTQKNVYQSVSFFKSTPCTMAFTIAHMSHSIQSIFFPHEKYLCRDLFYVILCFIPFFVNFLCIVNYFSFPLSLSFSITESDLVHFSIDNINFIASFIRVFMFIWSYRAYFPLSNRFSFGECIWHFSKNIKLYEEKRNVKHTIGSIYKITICVFSNL